MARLDEATGELGSTTTPCLWTHPSTQSERYFNTKMASFVRRLRRAQPSSDHEAISALWEQVGVLTESSAKAQDEIRDMRAQICDLQAISVTVRLAHIRAAIAILYKQCRLAQMSRAELAEYNAFSAIRIRPTTKFPTPSIPQDWDAEARKLAPGVFDRFGPLTDRRNESIHTLREPVLRVSLEAGPLPGVTEEDVKFLKLSWLALFGKSYEIKVGVLRESASKSLTDQYLHLARWDRTG